MKRSGAFLLIILSVFMQVANAQDKGYIGLHAGPVFPTGSFGNKNLSDSTAGFAKTGILFGLSATYNVTNVVSVTGMFNTFSNNMDEQAIAKQAAAKYPPSRWTVQSDNWNVLTFLAGPTLNVPLDGAQLILSGLAGVADATLPQVIITGTQNNISSSGKISGATANAFCFWGGLSIRKNISPKLCITFNGSYVHTRPVFYNVTTTFTNGAATTHNVVQDISAFTLSIGVGYRFGVNSEGE